MKDIKRLLLIGILAAVTALGTACGKSVDASTSNKNSESSVMEKIDESAISKKSEKIKFKKAETLGTIGEIDLEADTSFPKSGFLQTDDLILGSDDKKNALCFFYQQCINKLSAEEVWKVDYTEELDKIPQEMKKLKTVWDDFVDEPRMYNMYSDQKYEIIPDNAEKVSYGGIDFIKEEGHIDITRKDPADNASPELVRSKYITYYYFSPKGAGATKADNARGYGMGMAIWGTTPTDMSLTGDSKKMEENYEKLKNTAEVSMNTLTSFQEIYGMGE